MTMLHLFIPKKHLPLALVIGWAVALAAVAVAVALET